MARVELPAAESLDPAVAALLEERMQATLARPEEAEVHGRLGLALEANELWHEAGIAFANAARLDPSEPHWSYHRAIALAALGEHEPALELLRVVAKTLPGAPYVAQRLGEAALAAGAFEEARRAFEQTAALAPDAAEGHAGLGASELDLGRPEKAVAALEHAVALDPQYKSARYRLGLAYRALGRLDEAERELAVGLLGQVRFLPDPFATDLRRDAVGATARLSFGLQLLEGGRPERAVRVLESLRVRAPENVTVLNNLAIAQQRTGDFTAAQARLDEAARLEPGVVSTWINLAALALEQKTTVRAREHAERAVSLAPESAKAHLVLGRVLQAQKHGQEALEALETARRLDPRETEALALAGRIWLELGEHLRAREAFETLAAERSWDPLPWIGLAEVAQAAGAPTEALRALERARAIDPHHPEVVALARQLAPKNGE